MINGRKKRDGTVLMFKKYYKKHNVVYSGTIENNNHMKGKWETNVSGPFEMKLA